MAKKLPALIERLRAGRVRILWLVLGAMFLVSVFPIGLYHRQVLTLSQDKLVDNERVQQTDLTRSLSQEIQLFNSNLTQQLVSERQILALTGLIQDVEDPAAQPKVKSLLENFVDSNRNTFIYLAAVGKTGKGTSASQGNFLAEQDPFVSKALQRAFMTCLQSPQLRAVAFRSDPLALAPDNRPAIVVAIPLNVDNQFTGMLAAVVAQRCLAEARTDAGVTELNRQAFAFVTVVVLVAIIVGYFFAVGISGPVRSLAASTRAISRGEFHHRSPVRGASEISELAENFNKMAGDIEEYIEKLKEAAEENRELFIGSIRMLAAAIDEKDPYTRGHSGRVAKYSMLIGRELGLSAEELDRLRISALLHDVGKIGVDDRVLKKPGSLTPEEFALMKQHTVKGANIMRPVSQLKDMLPGIELHHEHIDGRGYPYGLSGQQIPMMARIIGVADTLDAMTTNRPYQSAMDLDFALGRIKALAGSKFDPVVVTALESAVTNGRLRLSAVEVQV